MPALYVVATPIGNLEDITLRALRILRDVKLIAAEDTRKARLLLNKYEIKTPTTSYYEHSRTDKLEYLLKVLETADVALVSEAGTPGMSDPGYELIVAAQNKGIKVVPIPGCSVAVVALTMSGLPNDRMLFMGFLPRTGSARRQFLKDIIAEPGSLVMLEAPHRIPASLKDILTVLGDRRIAVCREMTKIHEEVFRGTVSEAIAHFKEARGEFTLVVEGNRVVPKKELTADIETQMKAMNAAGMPAKEALGQITAATGLPRKELYRAWLKLKQPGKVKVK